MAWHGMASDRIESGVQALNALVQSEVISKCVSFRNSQGYHYRCRATLPDRGPMLTRGLAMEGHALYSTHLQAHAGALCVWRSKTSLGTGGAAMRANRLRRCMAHQSRRRGVCAMRFARGGGAHCPAEDGCMLYAARRRATACLFVATSAVPDVGGAQCSAKDDP
jgi:hypothetical protein